MLATVKRLNKESSFFFFFKENKMLSSEGEEVRMERKHIFELFS